MEAAVEDAHRRAEEGDDRACLLDLQGEVLGQVGLRGLSCMPSRSPQTRARRRRHDCSPQGAAW
eukprot:11975614-Alexandrium_andersonii.AAC.1